MKIAYQGIEGSYSESCAKEIYPDCETISCKTFDDVFKRANDDENIKAIIPESNKTTGNIGIEYLIFKFRLNIYAEHFFKISHNLLGVKGSKIEEIKDQIIAESNRLQIPPNQILHTIFVNKLPKKYTLVEGFNGPDPYVHNGKHYLMESANSVEYARLRAYKTLCKARTVVGFEKDEYILLSILKDDILTSMCNSWNYYNIEGLSFLDEEPISVINYWDLFIKPIFYIVII